MADFQVDEILGFDPAGDGEHLWMQLQKTGWNTRDVIELVAKKLKIAARDVGYSGLKDRNAVTTQWLSIPLAKLNNRPAARDIIEQTVLVEDGIESLQILTGPKKLRTGTHRHNRFCIVLREFGNDVDETNHRLQQLRSNGFPNYFGEQRFGRGGSNLERAIAMFRGQTRASKFKRGMYISAARAFLFNQILAARVNDHTWNKLISGEVCMLDGTNSVFLFDEADDTIRKRCDELDIHPTAPLHGRGETTAQGPAFDIERRTLELNTELADGLESAGLKLERRALRAVPADLEWRWLDDQTLEVAFTLRRGVYATALLSELAQVRDASHTASP